MLRYLETEWIRRLWPALAKTAATSPLATIKGRFWYVQLKKRF